MWNLQAQGVKPGETKRAREKPRRGHKNLAQGRKPWEDDTHLREEPRRGDRIIAGHSAHLRQRGSS